MNSWANILKLVHQELGDQVFDRWFRPTHLISHDEGVLRVAVPDTFFRDWLTDHYLPTLIKVANTVVGKEVTVEFVIDNSASPQASPVTSPFMNMPQAAGTAKHHLGFYLNPRYTFDTFIIGPSNRFAHAASVAVADSPARAYNPLFIYGGVGLGKTHLMQAIGHHILNTFGSNLKIFYISSEGFTNQLITAIQNRNTLRFREKYRGVDVILIDDIQFISGKEATQEEFFHTFNALFDAHKQIVISSDRAPKDIAGLEERLVSRFEWGLVTDIQPPDLETRIAILQKKAERETVAVGDDVLFFLAENIKTNVRELEGALIRIVAFSTLTGEPIKKDLVKNVLRDMLKEQQKRITIQSVQEEISLYFNLSENEIKSKRRTKQIVFPRQLAMYLIRSLTNHSLNEIGEAFGGRDHTTVIHACEKISQQCAVDKDTQKIVDDLTSKIKG